MFLEEEVVDVYARESMPFLAVENERLVVGAVGCLVCGVCSWGTEISLIQPVGGATVQLLKVDTFKKKPKA